VSSPAVDDDLTADLIERHRHHAQGGVTMFIALSLDTLGLPPDQQAAVTKIQADLFTAMEPARLDEQNVLNALADGIAAGDIDKTRVDAAISKLAGASGVVHEATMDALNRLHAALTPPERAAVVYKVWAHWAVFRQANGEDEQVGGGQPARRLTDLATDIGLSPDQVTRIRGALASRTQGAPEETQNLFEVDAHLKDLDSFREDTFNARRLSRGTAANSHVAARGAARMAGFYEAVLPLLTPEQRAKLVTLLREHASHQDVAFAVTP
jgi:Spy/CpxP family protein refolding chaperone